MKTFYFVVGLVTLAITLTHGFFWEPSILHGLLVHPLLVLMSLGIMALGEAEDTGCCGEPGCCIV